MVKSAYRKFLARCLPFFILNWLSVGVLAFILQWAAAESQNPPDPQTLRTIFLVLFLVAVCFPLLVSVQFIRGIKRFQRKLSLFSPPIQARMEEDFQQGDHLGPLYFTTPCLITHQLGFMRRASLDCIPYSDISSIQIQSTANCNGQQVLSIVKTSGPSQLAVLPFTITAQELVALNQKVSQLASGNVSVQRFSEENQAVQDIRSRLTTRDRMNRLSIPLLGFCFGAIFLYFIGFLGILSLPGFLLNFLYGSEKAAAHLKFWPNLLFLLWTAAAIASLLAFTIRSWRRRKPSLTTLEWTTTLRAYLFSIAVMGFILFIAAVYCADTELFQTMAAGFQELLQ